MNKPLKILFKYPSRGRPDRFFDGMDSIYRNLYDTENFHVLITADEDDVLMNNDEVRTRLKGYLNHTIIYGKSESKIHAVNRDINNLDYAWDVLVVSSDDIRFCIYGFDQMIRTEMEQHFPEGDGYLHFLEKDSQSALNVMTVIDHKYYSRFNWVYHPEYLSLWCDNEQFETAKILGRYVFVPYEIFHHFNPAYGYVGFHKDEMFIRQQEVGWSIDHQTYLKRKGKNFDI